MAIRQHLFALSMTALHIGCPRSDPGSHADVTTSDAVVADDGAGDVNGDGFDDFIVGQPGQGHSPTCLGGRAHVFSGGAMGVALTPAVTLRGPENPLRMAGYPIDRFGDAIAAAR